MTEAEQALSGFAEDSPEARRHRMMLRLRQAMVELEREPAGLQWSELWSRVAAAYPPVPDDLVPVGRDEGRGENNVHWYMQNLDKSGWVLTGAGPGNRITRAGRLALRDHHDAASLLAAADEGYKAWNQLRQHPPARQFRAGGLRPTREGEAAVLHAARQLLETGLRSGGSVFDPGRRVWDAATVAGLQAAFVEQPDLGSRSFLEKLRDQLAGAGDDVILLSAEMLTLLLLPADDWKGDAKRSRVKAVLAMMADPVHIELGPSVALDKGVYSAGLTLKTLLWRSFSTLIEVATAWWALDDAGRALAWDDPWVWRDLVESAGGDSIPTARYELCYLAHPETFSLVIAREDRERVVKAYSSELASPTGDLDRDLYAITMALQEQVGPGKVDYYRDPWVARWRHAAAPSGQRAWLVRSTQGGAPLLSRWREGDYVSVLATHLPDVAPGSDAAAVKAAVDAGYQHVDYAQRLALSNEYFDFLSRMKADDIVATIAEDNLHVGVIAGEAEYRPEGEPIVRRAASWALERPKGDVDASVTSLLNRQGTVVDITAGFDSLRALLPGEDMDVVVDPEVVDLQPSPVPPQLDVVPGLPDVSTDLAGSLHMPVTPLQEIVDLLQTRQQIVLYGPPGTGKTYVARKLAEFLVGDDPSRAQLVQFHPSYAYEDFFEGYRPVSEGGQATFELKPGPLRLIAGEAAENRGVPFILIIDEMNRTNLAKVFGELYFLLEYRDESMRLQYQPTEAFKLPRNLFIIGTMNTADRSIALVDAAIRRRFAFVELHPETEPVKGVLASFLEANGHDGERAALLAALNGEIEEQDRDLKIGPSYLMKADAATPGGLERIWKYEILPLLEEHYYGRLTRDEVHARFGLQALRASLTPTGE